MHLKYFGLLVALCRNASLRRTYFFALFEADVGWGAVRWRNMNFQIHKLRVAANGVTVRARRISSGGRCRPDFLRTVIVQIFLYIQHGGLVPKLKHPLYLFLFHEVDNLDIGWMA